MTNLEGELIRQAEGWESEMNTFNEAFRLAKATLEERCLAEQTARRTAEQEPRLTLTLTLIGTGAPPVEAECGVSDAGCRGLHR